MYIANKAGSGLLNGSFSMKHRRSTASTACQIAGDKSALRLRANLTGLFSELPYLPYTYR